MEAKRVAPAREEDVQVTMTAAEARELGSILNGFSYRSLNQLYNALKSIGAV